MKRLLSWETALIAGSVLALTAGSAWAAYYFLHPGQDKAEYATAPFTPVGKDYPRIFPVRDAPTDWVGATAYWKERDAIEAKLEKNGALSRASEEERHAFAAAKKENFVMARELSEKVLLGNPDAIAARYVMAWTQFSGERNLPRALFEVRQTRYRLEKIGQAKPDDADGREWYLRVLELEEHILGYMDRREEQLQAIAALERVYQPMPWLKCFPLIKLKRYDEVAHLLDQIEKEGSWPLHVLNERFILADEKKDLEDAYRLGQKMIKARPESGVLWLNFGLICETSLRPEEAEKAYTKAATGARHDYNNSAFMKLSEVHLGQGRFQEAWNDIKSGQLERGTRKPYTLAQDQSIADRCIADVLLATGHGAAAERLARRAWERPSRLGFNTATEGAEKYVNGMLLREVLRTRIEELREEDARLGSLAHLVQRKGLATEIWTLEKQLLRELADADFVAELSLPYTDKIESLGAAWLHLSALDFLPAGVAVEMQRQGRELCKSPKAEGYFDARDAALAFHAGRKQEALETAKRALEKLPLLHERLLRARLAAMASESARRLGQREDQFSLANQTLHDFPQAFRMVDVTIPVRVSDDGSPLAHRVARELLRSPRFHDDPDGFSIQVRQVGNQLEVKMHRLKSELHCLAAVPIMPNEDETAANAYRTFHEHMMSPGLDVSDTDVNFVDSAIVVVNNPQMSVVLKPPKK